MVSGAFEEAFVVEKATTTTTTTLFTKSEIIYLYLFGYVSLILINLCLYVVVVRCSSNIKVRGRRGGEGCLRIGVIFDDEKKKANHTEKYI